MSALCSGYVFERYPAEAPLTEFVLALALADNAHNDGTHIFLSVPSMADKARQSVRSVKNNLQVMLARRWLLVVRASRGGRGRWPEYRINPEWLNGAALAPFPASAESVDNSSNGAATAPFPGPDPAGETVQTATGNGANGDSPYRTIGTQYPPTPLQGGNAGKAIPSKEELAIDPALHAVIIEWPSQRVELTRVVTAWRRVSPDAATAARILSAARIKTACAEWRTEAGKYAPHLHKWLRRRSWLNPDVTQAIEAAARASAEPASQAPALTREQMAANKQRARDLLARFKAPA